MNHSITLRSLLVLIACCLIHFRTSAQNEPFHGGYGDGYGSATISSTGNLVSTGSSGDGHDAGQVLNTGNLTSTGLTGDGYAMDSQIDFGNTLSRGSIGDGYDAGQVLNAGNLTSTGLTGDGYDAGHFIKIYWRGDIGTAWLNPDNWSSGSVPVNSDEVIIPAGRPHYPLLGAQLLSIGDPEITSGFRCAAIWVQDGASFSGKAGTTLANYSDLVVDGIFIWQNPAIDAFYIYPGGEVVIRTGGLFDYVID